MSDLRDRIEGIFTRAPFMTLLGVRLVDVGEGWVETELELEERLTQQHGFAHAGVVSTLADHSAGAAATTAIGEGQSVLTADYTIHLLRPGAGDKLRARGKVVRAGRTLIVAEADVWADSTHCARYTGTMAVVDRPIPS
jgi:uncharacterized protein (TIGR00369 family)